MAKDYNSQAFTPEEVKKGLHLDLINNTITLLLCYIFWKKELFIGKKGV